MSKEEMKERWRDPEDRGKIILGEEVRVTDPAYGMETWCAATIKDVLPGDWNCRLWKVEYDTEWNGRKDLDVRVASIEIRHEGYEDEDLYFADELMDADIGVDSGQCGFFDKRKFEEVCSDEEKKERFYDEVGDMTQCTEERDILGENQKSFLEWREGNLSPIIQAGIEKFLKEGETVRSVCSQKNSKRLYEIFEEMDKLLDKMDSENLSEEDKAIAYSFLNISRYYQDVYLNTSNKVWVPDGNTYKDSGFVSSSGFGDGSYNLYVGRNDEGKIVVMELEFIRRDYEMEESLEEERE